MSVSAINSATAQTYPSTGGAASSTAGTSGTPSPTATPGTTAASTSTDAPSSSTIVTISPAAQVLAGAAAAGISISQASIAGLGISAAMPLSEQFSLFRQAMLASKGTENLQNPNATVSQLSFDNLVSQFGGTQAQASELFQGFDTNGDGSISNEEFETGLANASQKQSSAFAQTLFELMDTDGSGSVSASEFTSFERAFLQAENSAT